MSANDTEQKVLKALLNVAPDIDVTTLKRDVDFREQFDFDSMDTLNFAIGIHEAFNIEVPETDYRYLASLNKVIAYVSRSVSSDTAPKQRN